MAGDVPESNSNNAENTRISAGLTSVENIPMLGSGGGDMKEKDEKERDEKEKDEKERDKKDKKDKKKNKKRKKKKKKKDKKEKKEKKEVRVNSWQDVSHHGMGKMFHTMGWARCFTRWDGQDVSHYGDGQDVSHYGRRAFVLTSLRYSNPQKSAKKSHKKSSSKKSKVR